ncbi:MAG: lamin tail domain-containing protein [Myxococcota bacterium]
MGQRMRYGMLLGVCVATGWSCVPTDDDSEFGEPTVTETPEPDEAVVVITEVMANPDGVSDSMGEWVELYNAGVETLDLSGWQFADGADGTVTLEGLVIKGRSYVVVGNNNANQSNGGVSLDYAYDDGFTLGNESESLTLKDGDGKQVDRITWSKAPQGASLSLDPTRYDVKKNDSADSFCASRYSLLDSGDFGTPGKLNDVCFITASPGDLVITELMINPLAVEDTLGEWLELYNTTSDTIKLDGWILTDGAGDSHTIASAGELSIGPKGYLVIGTHAEKSENGNVVLDYTYDGDLIFTDEADVVSVYAGTVLVDAVGYGATGFPTTPVGSSLQLDNTAYSADSNDDGSQWCASTDTIQGSSDKGTPGEANNACP